MRERCKKPIDYYILPNKMMCSVFGLSPTDGKYSIGGKIFAYFRLILSFASVSNLLVPQIMLIVVTWGDVKILTEVGCVATTMAQYIFKLAYVVARRERINKLYKELRSIWDSTDDLDERQSYEEFAYWAKISSILVCSIGVSTLTLFGTAAVVNYLIIEFTGNNNDKIRYLPFDVWYGTDVMSSPKFEIVFVCQFVGAMIATAGIWGIETSCMTTILHVCGQFKLINAWISKIGIEINCEPTDRCRNCLPSVEANLDKCIRHHQRLMKVVDEVNNIMTPIIFMQILTSGIEICLCGFAVLVNDSSAELVKAVFYLSAVAAQLLLWCCSGEILIQESQEIGNICYSNIPWYKLPPTYRRQLILMILRSQKYCSVTALTFERVSYHTLTCVFNTAASYFALLRQMQAT